MVTVCVLEVAVVVVSDAAVAVWAFVVVVGVVCDATVVVVAVEVVFGVDTAVLVWLSVRVVVGDEVPVGAVGRLTLAVLLVICVSVFEMLLAMLDAPPEPHPVASTLKMPTSVAVNSTD